MIVRFGSQHRRRARHQLTGRKDGKRDEQAAQAHYNKEPGQSMIADEQHGSSHQLDIAAAKQPAPEQQKTGGENRGGRGEAVKRLAGIAGQDQSSETEGGDGDGERIRDAAGPHIAIGGDREKADPEDWNDAVQ